MIMVVAAIFRLWKLDFQSIWMDEIYTMNISNPNVSFSTTITEINVREGFPYLYFFILKILFAVFGYDPIVARLFSVVLGVASVYMIYKFGKILFSKQVGLIAAVLTAFSEYFIYISQDARPYTFYFFAVLVSFHYLVRFLRESSLRNAILYGLACALVLNTNFFSFINLLAQAVVILFFLVMSPKESRLDFLKKSVFAGLIAILLFIPNYKIMSRMLAFKSAWIPMPTPETFSLIFKEFLGTSEITLFIFTPLFLYFLFDLFKAKDISFTRQGLLSDKKIFAFTLFLPWVSFIVAIIYIKSYTDTPVTITRYFTSILPVFFLVFAAAFGLVRNSIVRYSTLAVVLFFMLANLVAVKKYYKVPSKTQWREAADFVITNDKKGEPVYTSLKYWFDYFMTAQKIKRSPTLEVESLEALVGQMMQDSTKVKAFWYIDAHGRPFVLSESAQQFVSTHFYVENNFEGYDSWGKHFVLAKDAPKVVDISKFGKLQEYNGDGFPNSIETLERTGNIVKVNGWAYFENQDATNSTVAILFVKDDKAERFNTQKVNRPDVTSYFKSEHNLDNSGFSSTFDVSGLAPGNYKIAVHLVNKVAKKEGLIITNRTFDKK